MYFFNDDVETLHTYIRRQFGLWQIIDFGSETDRKLEKNNTCYDKYIRRQTYLIMLTYKDKVKS